MSHEHHDSSPSEPISTEKRFPHSGKHGFEKPVREFDNTTLEEAHDMGLIDMPDSPAELLKDKKRKPLIIGSTALVASLIAGGAWLGLSGGHDTVKPQADQTTSAPATPGETPVTTSPEVVVAKVPELTVAQYPTADSLVRGFVAADNAWVMSGATPDFAKNQIQHVNDGVDGYTASITEPLDAKYTGALLVDNWQNVPGLRDYAATQTKVHHAAVAIYLSTTNSGDAADKVPYTESEEVTNVTVASQTPETIVANYTYVRHDNSDQNRGDFFTGSHVDGAVGSLTVTFKNVKGVWKLADVQDFVR